MKIKTVSVDSISQDPANLRRHGQRNLDAIVASLRKFGQQHPIVIDESGVILSGNGRYEAAKRLGWTEIAVITSTLKGSDATAYAIADNRTAELAEWDGASLAETLRALQSEDYEIEVTGYNDDEIDKLIDQLGDELLGSGESPEVIEDDIPEPPVDPITKAGDLWILGNHRLLCGDSTNPDDVARLMNGEEADMLLSDPPYGVSYKGKTEDSLEIENDNLPESELRHFITSAFDHAENSCRGGSYWYATVPPGPLHTLFAEDWKKRGILRQIMVWAKNSLVMGHSEYHYQHEPILFGWIPGKRHKNSDRTRTTLWKYDRPASNREHPTMKPVALWAQAVNDGSRQGETVYDPFLGSGTTLIAAEQLGRKCYGMEIGPQYCDVIVKRWERLTGMAGVREAAPLRTVE